MPRPISAAASATRPSCSVRGDTLTSAVLRPRSAEPDHSLLHVNRPRPAAATPDLVGIKGFRTLCDDPLAGLVPPDRAFREQLASVKRPIGFHHDDLDVRPVDGHACGILVFRLVPGINEIEYVFAGWKRKYVLFRCIRHLRNEACRNDHGVLRKAPGTRRFCPV